MKQKKLKRLLSLILSVAMVLSMVSIPNIVRAENEENDEPGNLVITVDGETSLDQALLKAKGSDGKNVTIKMDVDSEITGGEKTEDSTAEGGYKITRKKVDKVRIETNGHMITIPKDQYIEFGKDVTIVNDVPVDDNTETFTDHGTNHVVLSVAGDLEITGGTYQTAGVQLLHVTGTTNVTGDALFECTRQFSDGDNNTNNYYDGASLIDVYGAGAKLTMTSGRVNANVGNSTDCGMYAIYIWNGGEVELGKEDGTGPEVQSKFAAVAMNNTTAPGIITIKGGKYASHMKCTDKYKQYNAVIYLPGNATANISGGTFETADTTENNSEMQVISIPYNSVNGSSVRLKLNISGGVFKTKGAQVFKVKDKDAANKFKISVTGGRFSTNIKEKNELPAGSIGDDKKMYEVSVGSSTMYEVAAGTSFKVGGRFYADLQNAIDAAASDDGKSVELTGETVLDGQYTGKEGVTIDTKGYVITVKEDTELTLNNVNINNRLYADKGADTALWGDSKKNHTIFDVDGTLNINGGTYTTKGVYLIDVKGTVVIDKKAVLECDAESSTISSSETYTKYQYYDTASLINVTGKGSLTVLDATINANVGNGSNCGMYGIYVNHGGKLTLGKKEAELADGENNPKIDSMFAPIGMNGTASPGKITVNGGEYTSHVNCTVSKELKFNAVLYLPASADVTINGGTFTAAGIENAGTKGEQHVISIPYTEVDGNGVKLNLHINGGTFKAGTPETNKIFFDAPGNCM